MKLHFKKKICLINNNMKLTKVMKVRMLESILTKVKNDELGEEESSIVNEFIINYMTDTHNKNINTEERDMSNMLNLFLMFSTLNLVEP